ncbi:hypothetical protein M0R45_020511 [Rubus argutus]|uniref:Uncharacterized protein n=1 Tax=Rubus argutus TaxID=59490 RepID=A0AAW1XA65_RUBAR
MVVSLGDLHSLYYFQEQHEKGEYFSRTVTGSMIVGFYGCSETTLGGLREIGVYMKSLNYYPIFRPNDLLPAGDYSQIKLKKDEDNNTNKHSTWVVDNNEISRIKGNGNGNFTIGNRIKYVVNEYKYLEKP